VNTSGGQATGPAGLADNLEVRLAESQADILSSQRLRYRVFVEELGADGPLVDHGRKIESDAFDAVNDHLVLVDRSRNPNELDHVVGVYRLLPDDRAAQIGRYYSDSEYDLTPLRQSGRRLLELGRSCVDPAYRGGTGMFLLWNGLADYVLERGIEVLFGVASFHGTDPAPLRLPLAWLHHHHLAPEALCVQARTPGYLDMDLVPKDRIDRKAAMLAMPTLIKAYLRLGGFVGEGAYIDREFNTIDVCLLMDTKEMSDRHRNFYLRKHGGGAAPQVAGQA
jgi:L-ornithine Nalpha-acyltransferase